MLEISGEVITSEDVIAALPASTIASAASDAGEAGSNPIYRAVVEVVRRRVEEALLYREARADLSDGELEYLERYVDQVIRETVQKDYDGRQRAYERQLLAQNSSIDQQRDRIRRELVIQRYLARHLQARIVDPTRRELMQYFDQARPSLSTPERRELFLIEVPVQTGPADSAPDDAADLAKSRIDAARQELADGESFATVAARYSKGIHAVDGGAWGWVSRQGLRPRWQPALDVLFSLGEGQVGEVCQTDDAYFIVRCGRIQPGTEPDFESIQPQLQERYRLAQQQAYIEELMTRLLDEADLDPQPVEAFVSAVTRQLAMQAGEASPAGAQKGGESARERLDPPTR